MQDLGLNASRMVAGFAGGLLYSLAIRDRDPKSIVASIIAGAITANYLTDATTHYVPNWVGAGGVSFLTGLAAMTICQGIVAVVRGKFKVIASENSEEDFLEEDKKP